ncbi:MAG: transcriptional repressor [Anaerolineaceae bacterium]|nr:transcriptional repressor [Anaerolineaceae bacterium]
MMQPDQRLNELLERLRRRRRRLTPQRMAILRILTSTEEHLSVEQIHEHVKAEFPMTSLATVYKTISLLKEMGELLELKFANNSNRYDGKKPHPHPHLLCTRCQSIVDVEIPALEELSQNIADTYGYHILGHRLDFLGVCPVCQQITIQ